MTKWDNMTLGFVLPDWLRLEVSVVSGDEK